MADLGMTLNPADVPEDERSFEPFPAGDYMVQAIETDVVDTKTGTGRRLALTLQVMEGPYMGRQVFDGINILNQSAEAQRIGQRQLADLCLSVGLPSISNSDDLIGRPFRCRIGIQPARGEYGPRNVVKRWHLAEATAQPVQPVQPVQAARPAANAYAAAKPATTAGARPWAR